MKERVCPVGLANLSDENAVSWHILGTFLKKFLTLRKLLHLKI